MVTPQNPPRVLIVDDDVSDQLVLRRLLRDTPYAVDTVRSGSQALVALGNRQYAAVVADDERIADVPGATLLGEAERLQKGALRILLARVERFPLLADGAQQARYQLIARPFFAKPLLSSLVEHLGRWMSSEKSEREDTQRVVRPVVEAPPDDTAEIPVPGRLAQRRVLLTLAELVEAKAGHASGHGARVSALAALLGREAGLDGEALEAVEDAAMIHDVGELALDPALLQARRKLTHVEREQIARHVTSSWQIAKRAGLPSLLLDAIKHHHERWDGGGHPDALRGTSIPIGARIVAIADTWDALATDRPYRSAVPLDRCLVEFRALAGKQLDPGLASLWVDRRIYELIDWSDPPRPGVKLL